MSSPLFIFLFNDTATAEIYTLSLHDALPICERDRRVPQERDSPHVGCAPGGVGFSSRDWVERPGTATLRGGRSEEDTPDIQFQPKLGCLVLVRIKKYGVSADGAGVVGSLTPE